MGRKKRTRVPNGVGGPKSLQPVYVEHRHSSIEGARLVIAELEKRELPVNQKNWDEVYKDLKPKGCCWRTARRPGCRAIVDEAIGISPDLAAKRVKADPAGEALQRALKKAIACVEERDLEIKDLKDKVAELEDRCQKMSRGTRRRRRIPPDQNRVVEGAFPNVSFKEN